MKISFVIPVYNAAGYLARCVASLLTQTDPNWEAVFTDDGSSDGSVEYLRQFEQQDERIRVFQIDHEGSSGARNCGLDHASGELIGFVDADDFIHTRLVETVRRCFADSPRLDSVFFDYLKVPNGVDVPFPQMNEPLPTEEVADSIEHALCPWDPMAHNVWRSITRKSIVGDLRFYPRIKHQDMLFMYQLWSKVRKARHIRFPLYAYAETQGSVIRSFYGTDKVDANATIIRELTRYYLDQADILRLLRTKLFPKMMANVWKQASKNRSAEVMAYAVEITRILFREKLFGFSGFSLRKKLRLLCILCGRRKTARGGVVG